MVMGDYLLDMCWVGCLFGLMGTWDSDAGTDRGAERERFKEQKKTD